MIYIDWHSVQLHRGFTRITLTVIGQEMKGMIQMIRKHTSQQWAVERLTVGISMDLVRQKTVGVIFAR